MMKSFRTAIEGTQWHKGYTLIKSGENPSVTRSALLIDGDGGEEYLRNVTLIYDPINWSPSAVIKYTQQRKVNAYLNLLNYSEIVSQRFSNIVDKLDKGEISNNILATKSCKHGLFAYYKNDNLIGKSLEQYGEWGEHALDCLSTFLHEGDVVIDVGANIGTHAVYFAKKVGPKGSVHAFEPHRQSFYLLNMNAALNACDNVLTHQEAVSNQIGKIQAPRNAHDPITDISNANLPNVTKNIIPLTTIDDMHLEGVRLIKVCAQREREVILGAANTILQNHPVLFIENIIEEKSYDLLETLLGFDYQLYWHFASYFNENNFFGNTFNFFESGERPEINILALPAGISDSIPNLEPVESPSERWREAYQRAYQNRRSYMGF